MYIWKPVFPIGIYEILTLQNEGFAFISDHYAITNRQTPEIV